jgi:hypothetical protein
VTALCRKFFKNYAAGYPVDQTLATKAAAHTGAHLVAWTPRTVSWGEDKDLIKDVVRKGIRYIVGQQLEEMVHS